LITQKNLACLLSSFRAPVPKGPGYDVLLVPPSRRSCQLVKFINVAGLRLLTHLQQIHLISVPCWNVNKMKTHANCRCRRITINC